MASSPPLNVLISGSGIAGSVFAFWLLRAYPQAKITIVERAPSLRLSGASVDIRSTAVDVIKWMGVEKAIRAASTLEEGMEFVNEKGKPVATFRATGRTDIQSMTSEYEIHRGALAKIFIRPIEEQIELIYDETVSHYTPLDDGTGKVHVTFNNRKHPETYDLLVAADGLGSKIRGQMMGTKPRAQIYDEGVHAAYFTVPRDLLEGSKLAKWYNASRGRAVFLRPDPDPAGRCRGHFMNVTSDLNGPMKAKIEKALHEGNEAYMQLLEEEFVDAGWLSKEVLRGMRESDDFYCSLFAQVRSPALCPPKQDGGNVVLLGDAGYATPGFGTSLAILGPYILAGELLNNPNDIQAALKRYEGLMLPFVKGEQGGEIGIYMMRALNPQTSWGISIRNLILGLITWSRIDQLFISLAARFGWAEAGLKMPEYAWPGGKWVGLEEKEKEKA